MHTDYLLYSISELWLGRLDCAVWQAFLIAAFLLICDAVICTANWYMHRARILKYGYPRVHERKSFQKKLKSESFLEKLLMYRLCIGADKQGFFLWFSWLMNVLNVVSAIAASVGVIAIIITHADGWALFLALFVPFGCVIGSTIILFIPDFLFLPSERKRYRWK